MPPRRLGTEPQELGLAVPLDLPFHELKEFLVTEFERAYLLRILELSAMNVSMASRASGLSRKHIRTLMVKYGMYAQRALTVETPQPQND